MQHFRWQNFLPGGTGKKYGLTFGFHPDDFEKLLQKLNELLKLPDLKEQWQARRQKLLRDKINLAAFMVWFVEYYPQSRNQMLNLPEQ